MKAVSTLVFLGLLLLSPTLWAQEKVERVEMLVDEVTPPIHIEADEMLYDQATGRIDFVGHVLMTRGSDLIQSDRALWHDPTRSAEVSGNVFFRTLDFTATAERAAVNMDLQLAKIYNGRAFFPERHYYVSGTVLERQGPESLYVKEGLLTTCDGPEPSWSIEAGNVLINRGGLATATGVQLNSKYFPVLYLPYFMFPVKNERQTGFLIPKIGNSSRDGMIVSAPFFWELAEDYDLTILPIYRSKRGLALTLEGRYNFEAGQGVWLMTHLSDQRDNYYNYLSSGNPQRNSKELFWLRTQNNWQAAGWDLNLDLDFVSDPLFLYAFRNDDDGFNYSQRLLSRYFGRTVNEELDPMRLSTFFAQKTEDDIYFRGSLAYVENLYRRNNVDTLQNLPSILFSMVNRPLGLGEVAGFSPSFNLDVQYDYYTRLSNDKSIISEVGHRLNLSPSLFWNHNFGGVINLNMDGGLNLASYAPNGKRPLGKNTSEDHRSFDNSLSGDLNLEFSTTLGRVYNGSFGSADAILHQFTPTFGLELVESPDQSELPYWDKFDRRLNRRTVRYGFRNTFITRTPVKNPKSQVVDYSYQELVTLSIFNSYEFASNLEWAENAWARYYTTGNFDRGLGPVEIELQTNLNPFLSGRLLTSIDGYSGRVTSHDLYINLKDTRGDTISLIYDYDSPSIRYGPGNQNEINQMRGDLHLNLAHGWSTDFSSRYDLVDHKDLETYFTLRYDSQCYGVGLMYSDSDNDRRIAVVFDLMGLGSFGTPSTSLSTRETGS